MFAVFLLRYFVYHCQKEVNIVCFALDTRYNKPRTSETTKNRTQKEENVNVGRQTGRHSVGRLGYISAQDRKEVRRRSNANLGNFHQYYMSNFV